MKIKPIYQLIFMILLMLLVIGIILKDDYSIILIQLSKISLIAYLPILFLCASLGMIQGLILYRLAKPYQTNFKISEGILFAFSGSFFNSVTPLGGGQVSLTYILRKKHFSYTEIAAILWKDFFLFQLALIITVTMILGISMKQALPDFPKTVVWILFGYCINISVILFLYSMNRFPQLYIKISSLLILFLKKLHFIQDPETLFIKGKDMIDQFNIHTSQLKQNKKETFLIIITHGCRLLLLYAVPYLIALLLQLPLTLEDLFRVISISCFVHMLNALTPLPGDAGWSEGMFIFLFMSMFTKSAAGSMMILWRFATFYLNIILGACCFIMLKRKYESSK